MSFPNNEQGFRLITDSLDRLVALALPPLAAVGIHSADCSNRTYDGPNNWVLWWRYVFGKERPWRSDIERVGVSLTFYEPPVPTPNNPSIEVESWAEVFTIGQASWFKETRHITIDLDELSAQGIYPFATRMIAEVEARLPSNS
jgi:hypothetical protein